MTAETNDTRFCREHAFAGNPLFRVSGILAPQRPRQLTALYALFDLVQRIGRRSQEEGAARTQLAWWRQECLADDPAQSRHPALCELHHGGQARLDRTAFARLVDQVEHRLERPAMTDVAALRRFCAAQGRPLLELEAALGQADPDGIDEGLAARRGLWSLLTDCFVSGESPDPWWAPLSLLAREGLQRSELFASGREAQTARIIAEILAPEPGSSAESIDISNINQSLAHIYVMDLLVRRKHRSMRGSAPEGYPAVVARVRVREFLAAWSLARRINRQK
ncbi:MAG: squalene/phytoene synthase family protein [Xanthomonadales bacterium]